ncbi:MAG TPA: sucrase ferredoxin [Actinomycetota bacterium]|nr:sucrase ferredoxin [Actinomycetota bacterium]
MASPFRCADAAEARDEPLYGTASQVRRWLLLEHPGPWGSDAITQSKLPHGVELYRRAGAAGIRVVLIRRGARFSAAKRRCYFLRTEEGGLHQSSMTLDRVDDLLDIDLTPLRDGGSIAEAKDHPTPIFLVCTHGKHDACCSIRGNLVSRVACAEPRWDAWECSHIGGDRFAANVVCFPHGLYYGRVRPQNVVRLMDDYAQATLSLEHFRGRCIHSFPVQAAEYFARRAIDNTEIGALLLSGFDTTADEVAVTFSVRNEGRVEVRVRISQAGDYQLTCRAERTNLIPRYDLVSCKIEDS